MAFEGAGHSVEHLQDPLEALAEEAWSRAHLLVVDAGGEPLDGFRFCGLLRGESRSLFRSLPIYLVLEAAPRPEDLRRLEEAGGDGFVLAKQSLHDLLNHLGPVVEGLLGRGSGPVPVAALGLRPAQLHRVQDTLDHFGFRLQVLSESEAPQALHSLRPPLLLQGLEGGGARALQRLQLLRESGALPYTILLGEVSDEALERKLLLAGVSDWVGLPLRPARLVHACRRGLEWVQAMALRREYEAAVQGLREQRAMLEIEASSLRTQVLTDPLTNLLNRRAFDQNLELTFRQWERHGRDFSLVLADLDHFKLVNDRFGHPAGDEVLREMALRIRLVLRRSDLAFRIGGEEFAIILPETGARAGAEVAEKLRRCVAEQPVLLPGGKRVQPTMSFGVGRPESGSSPAELLSAVDQSLYQAKLGGRNRVAVVELPLQGFQEASG